MKVYLPHDGSRPVQPTHLMSICPAAHTQELFGETDVPASWVDSNNRPLNFVVTFIDGAAEVDDEIGRYLLKTKLARKTSLLYPEPEIEQPVLAF
ncbi:hypothetical protein [uncultured Alsobacter sp.]|uniref:hypothetical protein n=1 Tax=uncultured Alsobacter sp. TaxID=1748258 RepID=UPI0025E9EE65|nr:hypothetical protein [uncultured Alsobacter sp.]